MSARPALWLLAAVATAAVGLVARRRAAGPAIEEYPTPPLVQRPAPAPLEAGAPDG